MSVRFYKAWSGTPRLAVVWLVVLFSIAGCSGRRGPALMNPDTERLLIAAQEALFQSEFRAALSLVDSADVVQPDFAATSFLRGRIYSEMLRFDDAEKAYRRVLKLDPTFKGVWINMGNNETRRQEFERAIKYYYRELDREPSAIAWRGIGRAWVDLQREDSALAAFQRSVKVDPTYAMVYVDLAQFYDRRGDAQNALKYARLAIDNDSEDIEAVYIAGAMLVKLRRAQEAMPYLEKACKEWPWHHGSFYSMGQALAQMDRREESREVMKRAERLREAQAKITAAETIVKFRPNDAYAHATLGSTLRRAGRYNDAMHAYRVALFLRPDEGDIMNNVGALHLLRGDTLDAIKTYRNILNHDPSAVDVWLNLGVVYALSGFPEEALEAWRQAEQLQPNHPAIEAYREKLRRDDMKTAVTKASH